MLLFFALIARQAFKSLTSRKKSFLGGNEPGTNRRCDWPISVQLHYHGTSSLARLNITSPSLSSSSSSARRQLFFDIIIDPSPPPPTPVLLLSLSSSKWVFLMVSIIVSNPTDLTLWSEVVVVAFYGRKVHPPRASHTTQKFPVNHLLCALLRGPVKLIDDQIVIQLRPRRSLQFKWPMDSLHY